MQSQRKGSKRSFCTSWTRTEFMMCVILTQTVFVLRLGSSSVWSVFLKNVRVTWQRRKRESRSAHNAHGLQNTYVGSLRSQVDESCQDRGSEEGERKAEPAWPGLQVLTEARIVPSWDGSGGMGESQGGHVHIINIYTHSLSPFQHPDYVSLLTSSSHLGSLSAPTRSHSSRHGHPAFLRPVWERGRLEIRGQAESEQRQAGTGRDRPGKSNTQWPCF